MRLINTLTLEFKEFLGSDVPKYAILSHTWEAEEVSLQEVRDNLLSPTIKQGYRKIVNFCRLARSEGLAWAWVDTCCIDKTNLAELTESINSMFRWYQDAAICYVYLSDLPTNAELAEALPGCRWFTRGWTLQELLAPKTVQFYDRDWVMRGTKKSLVSNLEAITGIPEAVLIQAVHIYDVSIGTRMSWAAGRETTRLEDTAYCLLGIFDVNMPLIYGEGSKAFRRLQEEIIRQSNDLTIFAWAPSSPWDTPWLPPVLDGTAYGPGGPLLASSPNDFELHSARRSPKSNLRTLSGPSMWTEPYPEYAVTNKGLRIRAPLVLVPQDDDLDRQTGRVLYFLSVGKVFRPIDGSQPGQTHILAIILEKVGPGMFLRRLGPLCARVPDENKFQVIPPMDFYIELDDLVPPHMRWSSVHGVINVSLALTKAAPPFPTEPHPLAKVLRAIPESHWNRTSSLFYRAYNNSTVLAFEFSLELEERLVNLLCFIDQRTQCSRAYVINPMEYQELFSWFVSRKAALDSTLWEDLPGLIGNEAWRSLMKNEARIIVEGKEFTVNAVNKCSHGPDFDTRHCGVSVFVTHWLPLDLRSWVMREGTA